MWLRRPSAALLFGVALTVVACSDQNPTQNESPFGPQFAPNACNLMGLDAAVRDWFPNPERRDARDLIRAMGDACGTAAIAAPAWQVLDIMSAVFYADRGGDPASGAVAANRLVDCIADSGCPATHSIAFEDALSEAGTFDVVFGGSDPVLARDPVSIIDLNGTERDAWWGVEPSLDGAPPVRLWSNSFAVLPKLVWGYPAVELLDLGETPVLDDMYSFFRFTDEAFAGQVDVGVCFERLAGDDEDAEPGTRVRRDGVLLETPGQVPEFCATVFPAPGAELGFTGKVRSLLASVRDFFAPSAAYARGLFRVPPGVGGSAGNFSTFTVVIAGTDGSLEFINDPPLTIAPGDPFPLYVRALSEGGTPIELIEVHLYIGGNEGVPGGATFVDAGGSVVDPTMLTSELVTYLGVDYYGTAVFDGADALRIGKSGGYSVCAEAIDTTFNFGVICTFNFQVVPNP